MFSLVIKNAKVAREVSALGVADIVVEGGVIALVCQNFCGNAEFEIDANNNFVTAGFIDTHFHGAAGFDFCDCSVDAICEIARAKLQEGVTAIVPATLSLGQSELTKIFESAREFANLKSENFCRLLGIHLEGPFINPKMAGAQNPDFLSTPQIELVGHLSKIFKILKVSYSPELDRDCEFLRALCKLNIAASCAHSEISFEDFSKVRDAGLKSITHFGNRLSAITSRDIGACGAGLLFDDVFIEVIADFMHLSRDMLKFISAKKLHSKIILITDAMRASGMPDGQYSLGELNVIVKEGAARLASNGALAGSVIKMNEAIKNFAQVCDLDFFKVCKFASENPAQSLNLKCVGKIEVGAFADFAILNENAKVLKTIVGGKICFDAK